MTAQTSEKRYVTTLLTMNFVNIFGSIFTLLANSTTLLELGGSYTVSMMFFLKTIPPLFMGNYVARRVPDHYRLPAAALGMLAAALNVAFLAFHQSVVGILLFAFVASLVNSSSTFLITSVTSDLFKGENLKAVFRKQSAINCGLFAIAPAVGGVIAKQFGVSTLYLLDAATFVISAGLALVCQNLVAPKHEVAAVTPAPAPSTFFKPPVAFLALIAFVAACTCLDSLEFPIMGLRLDKDGVGIVLAAWGLGSALMFFLPERFSRKISTEAAGTVFLVGTLCFVALRPLVGMAFGFFLAGAAQVIVNGNLKTQLRESFADGSSTTLWASLNRYVAMVTLFGFGMFTALFLYVPVLYLAPLVPLACLGFLLILHRRKEGVVNGIA